MKMRKVTESNEMGDKNTNAKWVFPHLIQELTRCKTHVCVLLCMALVFLTEGCLFLPVPHKRQHIYATQGTVIDSDTGEPVAGAKVKVVAGRYKQETVTDSDGRFAVDDERGWHMIAWIATPSSGSLLPTHIDYEDGYFHSAMISAAGYPNQCFQLAVPVAGYSYIYPLERHLHEVKRPRFPLGPDGKSAVPAVEAKWY